MDKIDMFQAYLEMYMNLADGIQSESKLTLVHSLTPGIFKKEFMYTS